MPDDFISGSIQFTLRKKPFTMTGKLRKKVPGRVFAPTQKLPPVFIGFSKPDDPFGLGTINELASSGGIIEEFRETFGLDAADLAVSDIQDALNDLPDFVADTELKITDLVIDTRDNKRKFLFGFVLVFNTAPPLGPIKLKSVGLRISKGGSFTPADLAQLNS